MGLKRARQSPVAFVFIENKTAQFFLFKKIMGLREAHGGALWLLFSIETKPHNFFYFLTQKTQKTQK